MANAEDQAASKSSLSTDEWRRLDEFAARCVVQGLYGKAAEAYVLALEKARQTLGENHRDVAQLHLSLASTYRALGEHAKARLELEKCLQVSRQALGETNMLTAVALNQLGMLAAEQGEDARAETVYGRSLEMLEELGDEAKPTAAAVAMNLGLLFHHQGNRDKAQPLLDRSLELIQQLGTPETANTAQILNTLAWANFESMQYAKASALMRQSLAIREKVLGPSHPDLADSFDILAKFASKTGDHKRAIGWLKLSLSFREKSFGLNHKSVANTLTVLADAQDSHGEYGQAVASSERALTIRRTVFGSESHEVAESLLQLAALKSKSSRELEALSLAQLAMEIEVELHGREHLHVADCLETLSAIHFKLGDMPKVVDSIGQCLMIRQRILGVTNISTINTLEACALLGAFLGSNETVRLKIVLEEKEYLLGQENPVLVSSLVSLGRVQREQGESADASTSFERALGLAIRAWGDKHPETLAVRRESLFLMLRQQPRVWECIVTLSDLLKSERAWIISQLLDLSHQDALAFIHPLISDQTILHSLCELASGVGAVEANGIGAEQLASNKALYEELLATKASLEHDTSARAEELRERWRLLQTELNDLLAIEPNPGLRERRRREIQENLAVIETELYRRSNVAATAVANRSVSAEAITGNLPSDTVLCDFAQFWRFDWSGPKNDWKEARYAAYLTFPLAAGSTNVTVVRVDLGEAAPINDAVALISKRMSAGQYAAKDVRPALQRLSELVYIPLAKHLTNVSHLIICPDGQLNRLPFEMLPVGSKFLIEEKTISYVTSGREVVRLASPKPHVQSSKSLVMGHPDFDLDLRSSRRESALTQNSGIEMSRLTSAATRTLSRDARRLKFGPLPGSGMEATNVARLLGADAVLRLGAAARESELKAVQSPRVLHLATHGFFLSDQEMNRETRGRRETGINLSGTSIGAIPLSRGLHGSRFQDWENPLVRCGIALAGANHFTNSFFGRVGTPLPAASLTTTNGAHGVTRPTIETEEDGILTGLEASLLNLQGTELVILSACDSGSGELKIGEGMMSLRRAFRIAGAETVLASHWPVSDRATSQLMTEFMRRWRSGEPRAKAWREAQLSLLRSKDFSNPYFWAAFTLTGQWN